MLGAYKEYDGIKSSLLFTIYDSQNPVMFENAQHGMIMKYDLGCNDWFKWFAQSETLLGSVFCE